MAIVADLPLHRKSMGDGDEEDGEEGVYRPARQGWILDKRREDVTKVMKTRIKEIIMRKNNNK